MTTYEQLHKRICELIPEIKELKFGCSLMIQNYISSVTLIENRENMTSLEQIDVDLPFFAHYNGEFLQRFGRKHIVKIIGRNITLEDCLLAIGEGYAGEMTEIREGKLYWKFDSDEPMFNWQLNKPLQEQSEDTQKAILALIE